MNQTDLLLAIIPARAGSKRIPGKNIKPLAGKPLLVHSIECARNAPSVSRIVVSTDSPEIRAIAVAAGADAPFLRPPELAGDQTPTIAVILHLFDYLQTIESLHYEYLVLLEPTSPLRTVADLEDALQILRASPADSIVSVSRTPVNPQHFVAIQDGLIQAFNPGEQSGSQLYKLNGALYISRIDAVLRTGRLLGDTTLPYLMPELRSIDIDHPDDLRLAELLIGSDLL